MGSVFDVEQSSAEISESISENNVLENMALSSETDKISSNLKNDCETNLETESLATATVNTEANNDTNDPHEHSVDVPLSVNNAAVVSEDTRIDETVSSSDTDQQVNIDDGEAKDDKADERNVESVSTIGGSLQLIGEAYTSEDSQESTTNDVECKKESSSINFHESSEVSSSKEETGECHREITEPEHNVNNSLEMSDEADAIELLPKQDITDVVNDQLQNVVSDVSSNNVEQEVADEFSDSLKTTVDVPSVKCEDNSNAVCKDEELNKNIDISIDNASSNEQTTLQEEDTKASEPEPDSTMDQVEKESDDKIIEPSIETYVPEDENCKSIEQTESKENEEVEISEEELKLVELVCQTQSANASDNESNITKDETLLSTVIDKLEVDNIADVKSEQIEPAEKTESVVTYQVENIDTSSTDKPEEIELSENSNISKSICHERFQSIEEVQLESLESFISQSSPNINVPSETEDYLLEETSFDGSVNEIDDVVAEVDKNVCNEDNQDTEIILPEPTVEEDKSTLPEESVEENIETALEADTLINSDATLKDEVSLEVENLKSDLNSIVPASELDAMVDIASSANIASLENNSDKELSMENDNDITTNEMEETCNIENLNFESCMTEESEEKSSDDAVKAEKPDSEENLEATCISESPQQENTDTLEDSEDINIDFEKMEEIDMQMLKEAELESSSLLASAKEEENNEAASVSPLLTEQNISNVEEEENIKQPMIAESNENITQQSEVSEIADNKFDTDNEEVSDLKFVEKDAFLLEFDETQHMATEDDAEEEGMDEMNLTLDPEEPELQVKPGGDDAETSEKEDVVERTEEIEETEEQGKTETETALEMEVKDTNNESLNLEETSVIETNTDGIFPSNEEMSISDKESEESITKKNIEENLKNESENSNLKTMIESADNAREMFSEEQCQNTQDIVTSILDEERSATDFKNILETEAGVGNKIAQPLQESTDLPLAQNEIEELTDKLPDSSEDILNKDMEDATASQTIDSLEGLLDLDLMPEGDGGELKEEKPEEDMQQEESIPKDVDMSLILEQSNATPDVTQASDYITDVISSCLTDTNAMSLQDSTEKMEDINSKPEECETNDILKVNKDIITESADKDENVAAIEKQLEEDGDLPENELDMDFEGNTLESVDDLQETESKLDLATDILLENVDQGENLNDTPSGLETSQPSSEISELESAVKFLQESEEQAIDSPLGLSPKMVESDVDDISKQADTSSLFVPDEEICEDASELVAELQNIATDSIAISEAEIISEAAKLESERKLAAQVKIETSVENLEAKIETSVCEEIEMKADKIEETVAPSKTDIKLDTDMIQNMEVQQTPSIETAKVPEILTNIPQQVLKTSECIPKVSILEERLKEPPKIEIPVTDVAKTSMSPTTSKDSLLIQKDAKLIAYQRMLESPKLSEKSEPKIMDTPRKDSDKHDFENVGSPRIILKIAKSAIAECSEPRSPKSPKIRSATNSPNPEDSPGQKLGKIKLKLSKGGHPSIISNENVEEVGQWHSEGASSLSPIGMKIKLSKTGDASIVSSEKHESSDDLKETKHKFEESKRTESPIGMKIKLLKTGDASIVQDSKDIQIKHKDKLDIVQGSPKRTESPIGMKIKLSKTGDASIIQPERQESTEDHRENAMKSKEISYDSPKRTDSPIGMKIKLSKTGDASIVSPDLSEEGKESGKSKEKMESPPEIPKRTESPIGMKIKLAKTKGGASIISVENTEDLKDKLEVPDVPKRTESPLGMKIKLSKTGDASIVHSEVSEEVKETRQKEKSENKEKLDVQDTLKVSDSSSGMKIKVIKSGDTSVVAQESAQEPEASQEVPQKVESPIGMKIKLSKSGDASIVPTEKQEQAEELKIRDSHQEPPKRTESPIGMKIKLSKTGDASIIQSETSEDSTKSRANEPEHSKSMDAALGMKIKLLKSGDASIVDSKLDSEKKEKQQRRRDTESPLEMKIKLSKTGHPTIVACESHAESAYKSKDTLDPPHNFPHRYKEPAALLKEPALKILKAGHSTILQSNRSELTIEPVQMQGKKMENAIEISPKRKEITISPIESKKSKLETQLSQILPEVTIQPVMSRDQKQLMFDPKTSVISRQQMNVISQEISITQVRPSKAVDSTMTEKLKDILSKNTTSSPMNSDCEIIEHRPELIIVNENSNSSQDVMIIEEVPTHRMPEVKIPKKRGRPRRNPIPQPIGHLPPQLLAPRDPLSLDKPPPPPLEHRENERPKRTCRNQKSYAPPKRGRGRGRGKRKLEAVDLPHAKKPRIEQDLSAIEASTMAVITIDESSAQQESLGKSPELYKALKQPPMDSKGTTHKEKKFAGQRDSSSLLSEATITMQPETSRTSDVQGEPSKIMPKPSTVSIDKDNVKDKKLMESIPERVQRTPQKLSSDDKPADKTAESGKPENKDMLVPPGHQNWLTPTTKRQTEGASRHENVSTVQVIDEETRMSAESGSRSQTPARNISVPASETIVNEESQGSVLSTATTESEKVKVKNRRMEINFDPDEGPFTVDKIAEYEWPLDRKGETFMIQEQISQYLGVKSFKRKYPDLKRRVVDMEERNYLRENGLVSEAMCDMGLTAVCSSEVLDVMCSDFPDQYEEYRKHMREKQVKEHSKKQKELTAAANAEKNRIDLAEMAVQSALSWNSNLNKARKETRKCSLDLQTFTIHVPKKQQKIETERKISHYPVALIPGQYTDYYREYTAAELRYYPLNTVLYGPMRPNERKFDSQSEGSQSDSDSDSSSDDSSSSSSEGTQDTEGSQSTMDEVDMEIVNQKDEIKLKCKMCLKSLNKHSKNEVLIQCGTCNGNVHPSCIDLTLDMVPHIQSYAWQCTDCKTCAQCHDPADEDKMLFCDMCDRGYHIYCVGLRRVPQGRWHCQECAVCANCSSREPGGINSDRNSVAQWQHEYKKGDKNTRVYVSTLCVPCSKLWRKGRYCPHCSRCHTAPRLDLEANLVHCSACDKYLHLGCVETKGVGFDRKNYLCDFCSPNRQQVMKPLVSKIFKT